MQWDLCTLETAFGMRYTTDKEGLMSVCMDISTP